MYTVKQNKNETKPGIASLLVSLYLVVLSFFVLLNTLADTNDQKEVKTITELSKTFAAIKKRGSFGTSASKNTVATPDQELTSYLGAVKASITSHFPLANITKSKNGKILKVEFPMADLFAEENTDLSRKQLSMFENLSGINQNFADAEVEIRINIITDIGNTTLSFDSLEQNADTRFKREKAVKRANSVMSELMNYGFLTEQLLVGIVNNKSDKVEFIFTSHENNILK